MVQFKDLPIGKKLLFIIMGTCILTLMLAMGAFLTFDILELRKEAVRELSTTARIIGQNCSAALVFNDPADAAETLAALKSNPSVVSAWIFTNEKQPFAGYGRDHPTEGLRPPQVMNPGRYFEGGALACYEPILLDNNRLGTVYVQSDLRSMKALLKQKILAAAAVLMFVICFAFLLSSRLHKLITGPIIALGELAASVYRKKDYSVRGVVTGKDEVGDLVANFNRMLTEIEKRDVNLQHATEKAKSSEREARALSRETREINIALEEENQRRRALEAALRKYQEQLEDRVEERTRDLSETNIKLSLEISERRAAEEKIRESLEEKKLLLGEIHHRVKNNLQVISSLLDMTRRRSDNEEANSILSEARSRIYTMALIHSQLYESEHFNRIDMVRHTRKLLSFVSQVYSQERKRIKPAVEGKGVYLSVTQAIPCALVMNELISNVFKHAYGDTDGGSLLVSLAESDDQQVVIRIKDHGRGIPGTVDIERTETLGLKLARNLTLKQLRGGFEVIQNHGTEIRITFPVDHDDLLIH